MIEFLLRHTDPTFRLVKLEDDVPFFFRMLNYPFQISKSALYAAGSPHSWPNLLAALAWLVDLYNIQERQAEVKQQSEDFFDIYDYWAQSYEYFLQGEDVAYLALDERVLSQFSSAQEEAQGRVEQLANQVMELDKRREALKSEPRPLEALKTKKGMLLCDVDKFNTHIQNWTSHKASLEKRVEQHKQQLELKREQLETTAMENQALLQRVSEQTVNLEDFEKMTRELQIVEEDLQSATALRKEKEKETWDQEVLASKTLKKLESAALDCSTRIKRLRLPNLDGKSFEFHINPRGETVQDLSGIDIKQSIRPHLAALLEDMEKGARDKFKESTDLLKEIRAKEDVLQEKQASSSQLESEAKEIEAAFEKKQLESLQSELNKIRIRSKEDEEKLKALESESVENYARAKEAIEQLQEVCEQERLKTTATMSAILEAVTSHVEESQALRSTLRADVANLKERVSNNYIRMWKHLQQSGSK